MNLKRITLPLTVFFLLSINIFAQDTASSKADTANKTASRAPSKPKPYKEVITSKAITDDGLFKVHKVEYRYFFEIPDSLFDRDILVVNRISKAAADRRFGEGGFLGFAGDQIGESVIRFSKGPNNKIFIRRAAYRERSTDTSENGLFQSLTKSSLEPIVASFDIKAFSPDSTATVLDMTDYISGDNEILFFDTHRKTTYHAKALQQDKSYIERIASFPNNIEIQTLKTFGTGSDVVTFGLNSSIVLLPKEQMKPRQYDARVGYFTSLYIDYDANPNGVELISQIRRWRLEPKDEDREKYLKGELVEPKDPIVYYIDPATPKKWVPYLIQGVNDWQKAFEEAGFKNAIYALEAPKNDPEWSMEDARHNVIVYKPSRLPNASGPHVADPRTGEILETHINWYHNVMELLHDWYMIQAGPNDPRARKMEFDDELMGQLIRFVSSHEVGHTLGLRHNFGSSSTIPIDSLRSKQWVEANGHTPSIMDYARFNYVAQPEDGISERGLFPRIGVYDKWAINWGYRWFPDFTDRKAEKKYMNKWVVESTSKDKRLWFGDGELIRDDPRSKIEDLGDDAIKASYYGIKNLKIVLNNIAEWCYEPGEGYDKLRRMHNAIIAQCRRYIIHAANVIGNNYTTSRVMGEQGVVYEYPSKKKQKEAFSFLNQQVFTAPSWLQNEKLTALTGSGGSSVSYMQNVLLLKLLHPLTLGGVAYAETKQKDAYKLSEFLDDLKAAVWNELKTKEPIDFHRRCLQKSYLIQLTSTWQLSANPGPLELSYSYWNSRFDVFALIRSQLKNLVNEINIALAVYKDEVTRAHLAECRRIIQEALNPKGNLSGSSSNASSINLEQLPTYEKTRDSLYTNEDGGCDMWKRDISSWE